MLFKYIFPMLSVWSTVLYLSCLYHANYLFKIPLLLMILFFFPVVIWENFLEKYFHRSSGNDFLQKIFGDKYRFYSAVIIWSCIYIFYLLVVYSKEGQPWATDNQIRHFFNFPLTYLIRLLLIIYIAEWVWTGVAAVIWLLLYYFLVVKKRVLRIFTVLVLPLVLTQVLGYHFYFFGGKGDKSEETINKQPGVEVFYTKEDFPKHDYHHYRSWKETVRYHPRDLYVDKDQKALFAVYASTLGKDYKKKIPSLIRINLDTKETEYFVSYFMRDIDINSDNVLAIPWFEKKIFELDKKELTLVRSIPFKSDDYPWKLREIYYDNKRDSIYIVHDLRPLLQKYGYSEKKYLKKMETGSMNISGTSELWSMQVSEKTGKMYFALQAVKDSDIIEVEPESLEILRVLNLDIIEPMSLYLDDEKGLLYCQDGFSKKLFEIDLNDFKINRELKGVKQALVITKDTERNCLYLLDYAFGRLVALNLDTEMRMWSLVVGGKPYGMIQHAGFMYINSMAGIVRIDLTKVFSNYYKEEEMNSGR